jgi:hypothetical protein
MTWRPDFFASLARHHLIRCKEIRTRDQIVQARGLHDGRVPNNLE